MSRRIDRREFLTGALALAAAGVAARPLGGLLGSAAGAAEDAASKSSTGRKLVLCTLYGGNDGLNMVVPFEDPAYYDARSNIAVDANTLLPLSDGLGLNPVVPGFKKLWDAGRLAIVRGVGYPDASLSHFQGMAIWQTASPSGDVGTGWLGRWLDMTRGDSLRACSVGPIVLPAMSGEKTQAAAVQDSTSGSAQLPDASHDVLAIYRQLQGHRPGAGSSVNEIATSGRAMLSTARKFATALDREPPPVLPEGVDDGDIGTQLDIVSSLIRGGVPTQAYAVTQNGYDTHSGEVSTQTQLLGQLDTAITAFFGSLAGYPQAEGTTLLIHTEFGRRVDSNGSDGTDHGTANNVLVIGPSVTGGFYGDQPSLTKLDENGNLRFEIDFRSVYATVLEHVIGIDSRSILDKRYPLIGFI
ncbi:MAG: DUF1501 domain-containing protein [Acidimicrobiales bacterium]